MAWLAQIGETFVLSCRWVCRASQLGKPDGRTESRFVFMSGSRPPDTQTNGSARHFVGGPANARAHVILPVTLAPLGGKPFGEKRLSPLESPALTGGLFACGLGRPSDTNQRLGSGGTALTTQIVELVRGGSPSRIASRALHASLHEVPWRRHSSAARNAACAAGGNGYEAASSADICGSVSAIGDG
jgi:hypothetical protein